MAEFDAKVGSFLGFLESRRKKMLTNFVNNYKKTTFAGQITIQE